MELLSSFNVKQREIQRQQCMLIVLALGRLRRADQFKASLGFTDILSQKQKQEPTKRERRKLEEEAAEAP